MGTSGYTILAGARSVIRLHDSNTMKYINRLSYAGSSPVLAHNNPAKDILNPPEASNAPPRYSPTMEDEGYRVGQGGMVPKGGIYWSPPNSPKTAELQQQRQQQHRTWKLERQGSGDPQLGSNEMVVAKPKRRRFRKLLRKLSTSASSNED